MPKYWYDFHSIEKPESDDPEEWRRYELNRRIVANRKPYFMRYIYPQVMSDYRAFVKKANMSCLAEFRMSLDELFAMSADERTDAMNEFVQNYNRLIPVSNHDCVMNRICRRIEAIFAEAADDADDEFYYSIMKSGAEYGRYVYYEFKKLYDRYQQQLSDFKVRDGTRVSKNVSYADYRTTMIDQFRRKGRALCNNAREECDIVLDLCYQKSGTKQFAWDVVSDVILENLLLKNGGVVSYPICDPDGDMGYQGGSYSMTKMEVTGFADSFE